MGDHSDVISESKRTRSIVACIAATSTVTVALGLTWPLLAIVLEKQGIPAWLNGLSASAQMIAVVAIAPLGINASFVFLWGMGDVIGPLMSGAAMDVMGPEGMPLVGIFLRAIFLGFLFWRMKVMEPIERAEKYRR